MKKLFTLITIAISTIAWGQTCSDLFISEYLEGSSNNKALEVYNPTGNSINLSAYSLVLFSNGSTTAGNTLNFPNQMLAAGDVYTIANPSANATILSKADTTSTVTYFNGDDAIVLFKNSDTLDIIGIVGIDPGSNWPVGTGATSNNTLVRKSSVQEGQKDWTIGATEWDVYPQDTDTDLGMHLSICAGPLPTPPCSELFFSEYIEGSGNNKALEIYNPTNGAINLTGYTVALFNNGGTTPQSSFPLSGSLASGAVYVICANQANATILAKADTAMAYPSPAHFNGDDAVILLNANNDTIDAIGVVGIDPGSSWPVDTGSTANHTLVRKVTVDAGTNDWTVGATQWDVYPQDTTMHLGMHTSNCLAPAAGAVPIATITTVDANGVADSLNGTYIIEGLVSGNNLRTNGASGVEFWLIDDMNTAGLLVRNTSYAYYNVTEGDKLWVRGDVDQFNGLIQFVPDSISVISTGNTLPAANAVTALNETTDGRLNVMYNMTIVSGWPSPGSSSNVVISDGTNTFTLRADSDVYLGDSLATAPTGLVNIYGHGGQYDNSSPYTSGYQINPRYIADIQPVVVSSPTVNFSTPGQNVSEGIGTVTISMPIMPTSTSAETVKVYVANGAGITTGDYTTTPAAVNDTITLNVAAGDSASFDINVIDDLLTETDETITFSIASVSSGLTVGPTATHAFVISDNDIIIPTYNISDLKGLDADFVPDSNGVMCKVVGTVIGVDMQGTASSSVSFTVHNGTDGFGVFMPNASYVVTEGDEVRIIGTVGHFNGLAQINADSIAFISANNTLPTPDVFTVLDEAIESDLGRFNNATIIDPSQWTNSGSGFNVDITNGTDTIVMRIDKDVDLFSAPAPTGTFDVIGIGGQFDNSAPHNSGYQFLPRYIADIVVAVPPSYDLAITEIMANSNDPNSTVSQDWFELTNYGTTNINLEGFSWDDDSEVPNTSVFPNLTIIAGESIIVWAGLAADKADFISAWGLQNTNAVIVSADELTGPFPGLSSGGDAVVLFDSAATATLICKAEYTVANAGFSVEFSTNCVMLGNAVDGTNGAYTSYGGDVGSPGNKNVIGVTESALGNVNAYPNPVKDVLTLTLPAGEKTINILNLTGVTVQQLATSELKTSLNMSNLPNGIYLVKINYNGKTIVKRVVKN